MNNLDLEHIVNLVAENPNDQKLGTKIRKYVRENATIPSYSKVNDNNDPNQLSLNLDFGGQYVDVDEDEEGIDLGDSASNLSVG